MMLPKLLALESGFSREYYAALLIAAALPALEITPAGMIAGFYVAVPRVVRFWDSPVRFVELARRAAGLDQPRNSYWARLTLPGRGAVGQSTAHAATAGAAMQTARAAYARAYLAPEDYLAAAAVLPASGISAALLASGLDLRALTEAASSLPLLSVGAF